MELFEHTMLINVDTLFKNAVLILLKSCTHTQYTINY